MTTVLDRRSDPHATPGAAVEAHDVKAVNRRGERELYASRPAIYPKLAHGTFRRLKWAGDGGDARHLLRAPLAALEPGA